MPDIDNIDHYKALVEGLFALRRLGSLPQSVEGAIAQLHANMWESLSEAEREKLDGPEGMIEELKRRWSSTGPYEYGNGLFRIKDASGLNYIWAGPTVYARENDPVEVVPSPQWSGPLPEPVPDLEWGTWHEDADEDDNWSCWDTTRNWYLEIKREGSDWRWIAAYMPDDTAVEQTDIASTKEAARARAKIWATMCAREPRRLLQDNSAHVSIVVLIDSMFSMDSAEQADVAVAEILSLEAEHSGALWDVARSNPHVEVRASAAFLATRLLLGDRPLVAQGVRDAVAEADDHKN